MNNEPKKVKVVVKTLNTGAAKPIAVSSEDALNIARNQNANNHEADITINETKSIDEVINEAKEQNNINTSNNLAQTGSNYNQEVNIEKLNEVNDLYYIKKVKKDNPKLVIVLVIILVLIILGFFIFELPYLVELLRK
ncbi:MAG: hypothetical protein K5666_00220 [Bacilli bacterium]|nr:hypothetical protein [Bacilli bacterium]